MFLPTLNEAWGLQERPKGHLPQVSTDQEPQEGPEYPPGFKPEMLTHAPCPCPIAHATKSKVRVLAFGLVHQAVCLWLHGLQSALGQMLRASERWDTLSTTLVLQVACI